MRAAWLIVQALVVVGCWQDPAPPMVGAVAWEAGDGWAPTVEDALLEEGSAVDTTPPVDASEASVEAALESGRDAPLDISPDLDTAWIESGACGHFGSSCYGMSCCAGLACEGWICRAGDAKEEPTPCTKQHLGEGCEDGVGGWLECCPDLVCQQGRCVDPNSGTEGATACTCGCSQVFGPDGGLEEIDCTHGGCGCEVSGPVDESPGTLCPPLWVCYGPGQGEVCTSPWMPIYEGNSTGGSCKGAHHIRCAPCLQWKPC